MGTTDRPSRRWLDLLGVVGQIFIAAGLALLWFVAFQLLVTNYIADQHQRSLSRSLSPTLPVAATVRVGPAVPAPLLPPPANSTPIARLEIPDIGVDTVVVQGTTSSQLQLGAGHYRRTPLPGEPGNVGIAGHRTTWGRPFYNLDQLKVGAKIMLTTPQGHFNYRLTRLLVVDPSDVTVLRSSGANLLTLTTCTPKYSAAQRLVARAVLAGSSLSKHEAVRWAAPSTSATPRSTLLAVALSTLALAAIAATLLALNLLRRRRWIAVSLGIVISAAALFAAFWAIAPFLPEGI